MTPRATSGLCKRRPDQPAGAALDFANVNVVQALYWVAVINGVLAPFLLTGILLERR